MGKSTTGSRSSQPQQPMGVETSAAAARGGRGPSERRHRKMRSSLKARWGVLALACGSMTGIYFSYDIPSALHQQFQDYMPPSDRFEFRFNLLYTVYSVPNVVLPLFGGNFVDRVGAASCMVGFAALTFLGQLVFAMGTSDKSWPIMLLGRTIYGFGGESICVAQSTLLSHWFEGKEVALSFGIALAVSRLGSILNNMTSPAVANSVGTPSALWVGVVVNALSVAAAVVITIMDRKAERKCSDMNQATARLTASLLEDDRGDGDGDGPYADDVLSHRSGSACTRSHEPTENETVHLSAITRFSTLFWLLSASCLVVYGCVLPFNNVASGILLERNYFTAPPSDCQLRYPDQCTLGTLQNGTNPSLDPSGNACPISPESPVLPSSVDFVRSDSSWEEPAYRYDPLTPAHVDCGDPFWSTACTKDYCDAQNRATEKAGRIMSIPYFISASLSPGLGHIVDKIGCRAIIAAFASLMLMIVHIEMAVSRSSPVLPLIGQGIAYSFYAAVIWPSVPLTVEKELTGTAFGVITSIQNIGLALFPLIIASIYNGDGLQYIPNVEFFFVSCAVAGLAVGVAMNVVDARRGGKLNRVHKEQNQQENYEPDLVASLVPADDADYI